MEKLKDFSQIVAQATRGELVFPTSVNAALRLQLALADPDCEMDDVIRKVLGEPLLAARTVALANAAVFNRSGTPVTSVRSAVQRVGYRNLYTMAAAMVVRQFGARIQDARLRAQADQLWRHTAHVAALAHVIGRALTATDPDTALFAGIVHEAGGFYLLSRADEIPGLLNDPAEWMGAAQEIISREMMKKLSIPEPVSQAIVSLRGATLTPPPLGLRDTLLIAKRLAPVASPFAQADSASLDGFIDDNALLEQILHESVAEAASMSAALLV
ncbi:HDOD domain-containing protein [Duganella sp. sic0402]|uniref:HDOD domain-containing protein n=1 Tax=Duganella sp. sic0402 TaxID=2854786 RepID=UPI001C45C275|nr:HDOD domain-containing protein [Duganella sp. sic0402]MBV7537833.1 HDOD domain-containing protein [Duganella sp. sic0402]